MTSSIPTRRRERGYLLLETVCAMAVLSITTLAIHAALRQAALTRAQARDFTHARFLLEKLVSELEVQPVLFEETKEGAFKNEFARFRWKTEVKYLDLPQPPIPADIPPQQRGEFELPVSKIGKVVGTVRWERGGREYEETLQTLVDPDRLFIVQEERQAFEDAPASQQRGAQRGLGQQPGSRMQPGAAQGPVSPR